MAEFDPYLLSRIQFAANITFHILFPSITIALGWILLFFKLRYNKTKHYKWMEAYFFWTKIFALSFALGVVSGIIMSFQFGTNWPGFMETVGNIAGPLLAYEVLTAFFLEATFLGIMLFGFRKVQGWIHNLATFLVAFGTTVSAFWILVLNSWMQTPIGFEMIEGKAYATDWWAILFNPSMPYRLIHMLLASGLTACFLIAGVSAYQWLKGIKTAHMHASLKTSLVAASLLIPLQIFVGDLHGLNTLKHQPQKVAAMEALWETKTGAPFVIFGIPDHHTKTNKYAIEIPKFTSLILTHKWDAEVKGLNEFENKHPPVLPVFLSFRIMLGVGLLMLFTAWYSLYIYHKKKGLTPFTARLLCGMTFSGWIAVIAGWYVTEIGRQPYLVQGVLYSKDAVSQVPASMVGLTCLAYILIYVFLLITFIFTLFYMARKDEGVDKALPQEERWSHTIIHTPKEA